MFIAHELFITGLRLAGKIQLFNSVLIFKKEKKNPSSLSFPEHEVKSLLVPELCPVAEPDL